MERLDGEGNEIVRTNYKGTAIRNRRYPIWNINLHSALAIKDIYKAECKLMFQIGDWRVLIACHDSKSRNPGSLFLDLPAVGFGEPA